MNTVSHSQRDSFFTTLTNYLIVSGMLTCAAVGVIQLGLLAAPAWNAGYVPLVCFFVALESAYMTRYLRYHKPPVSWLVLRGCEAGVIFLMLRSLLGLMRGPQYGLELNPIYDWMDNELLGLSVIVLLAWLGSWLLTGALLDLEVIDPTLDREVVQDLAEAQVNSRQSLITFTVIVGAALVFLAVLINGYMQVSHPAGQAASPGLWHVLVYFLLALILFSRTRLSLLRAGWMWESLSVGQGVGRRWVAYTILILVVAISIAVLLPTKYSLGLLGTLGYLISLLIGLVQLIIFLIIALLYALQSLFTPAVTGQPRPQPPPPPLFFPPPDTGSAPPLISEFVQSLIFWMVFFIVAGYVAIQFLRQHPGIREVLQRLPGAGLLMRAWQGVRTWFGGLSQQLEDLREARRKARRPAPPRSAEAERRYVNLRQLSPRQQVQFFYLAMLRRSGERGYPRQATQTPYEYADTLKSRLPDVDEEVAAITDEFVEARYSRHDITKDRVSLVRRYWDHIKRALRK